MAATVIGQGSAETASLAASGQAPGAGATVAVLLCTFNGAPFIEQQLDSIRRQQGLPVRLYVSDDGSGDETLSILESYCRRWGAGSIQVLPGPGRGHVANFFSLVCSRQVEGQYFAYSDQDDIWDSDKLARATAALASLPGDQPALYCSRTRLVSASGRPLGHSPLFRRPPGFANALVHNIGGGNTMVLNRRARDLLRAAGEVDVVSQDWWTYLLVAGAGGTVIYDPKPSLSYRQHGRNVVGSSMGARERVLRGWRVLRNRNRDWNSRNIAALRQSQALLSPEGCRVLDEFERARHAGLLARLLGMRRAGIYAQSFIGNLGLIAATLFKKI
ncbi:MAG: glycosyltransferase family 2 protein [Pseudomonadales bacterium]|nr:glycosyltransferase family 2 protein [Pseudomonadales bacterium]